MTRRTILKELRIVKINVSKRKNVTDLALFYTLENQFIFLLVQKALIEKDLD